LEDGLSTKPKLINMSMFLTNSYIAFFLALAAASAAAASPASLAASLAVAAFSVVVFRAGPRLALMLCIRACDNLPPPPPSLNVETVEMEKLLEHMPKELADAFNQANETKNWEPLRATLAATVMKGYQTHDGTWITTSAMSKKAQIDASAGVFLAAIRGCFDDMIPDDDKVAETFQKCFAKLPKSWGWELTDISVSQKVPGKPRGQSKLVMHVGRGEHVELVFQHKDGMVVLQMCKNNGQQGKAYGAQQSNNDLYGMLVGMFLGDGQNYKGDPIKFSSGLEGLHVMVRYDLTGDCPRDGIYHFTMLTIGPNKRPYLEVFKS
jgi:hypothetical protein